MAETRAEILPSRGGSSGIVRGEEKREHEKESAYAGWADEHAEDERKPHGEFAVGYEEGDGRGVGKNEIAKERGHEGVGAAFGQELVDPELKTAVQGELRAEDFVLAEDEEEDADGDAESGQGARVAQLGR